MKRIITFIITLTFALLLTGCNSSSDEKLIKKSELYLQNSYKDVNFTDILEVKKLDTNLFSVNLNGEETFFSTKPVSTPTNITIDNTHLLGVASNTSNMFNKAKKNVINYIQNSIIIEESSKNILISHIENIPIYNIDNEILNNINTFSLTDNAYVIAFALNNTVYVKNENKVSERILTHELIHILSDYTNSQSETQLTRYSLLDEALTDVLTQEITSSNEHSSYESYWHYAYCLIGCYKDSVIKSYFYGFNNDNFDGNLNELEVFITLVELIPLEKNSQEYYVTATRFINSWRN